MGENKEKLAEENLSSGITKKCPFCANYIKKEAVVCQFCGRDLPHKEPAEKNKLIEEIFKEHPEVLEKTNEAMEKYGKGTYISYLKDKAKELGLGDIDVSENDIE
jgi:predicted amidophosphoribosyltransferase